MATTGSLSPESRRVPDAQYIRRELPIADVGRALGLEPCGRRLRCPTDRSHWAGMWLRKNSVKCFTCRSQPWSTIDLVMVSLGMDVGAALAWLAQHFDIPKRRVRVTTNRYGLTRRRYVVYPTVPRPKRLEPSGASLRRAPGWPKLSHGARQLALFLVDAIPRDTLLLTTTYRKLQQDVGIGNRRTVRRALSQLEEIALIRVSGEADPHATDGRFCNRTCVRLTWASPAFQQWLCTGSATATKYSVAQVNQAKCANRHKSEPGEQANFGHEIEHGGGGEVGFHIFEFPDRPQGQTLAELCAAWENLGMEVPRVQTVLHASWENWWRSQQDKPVAERAAGFLQWIERQGLQAFAGMRFLAALRTKARELARVQ